MKVHNSVPGVRFNTMTRSLATIAILLPALLMLSGCMNTRAVCEDEERVLSAVRERTATVKPEDRLTVPGTVELADGLSEAEAVQLALFNNAAFQELLTDLELAHSDLIQAGLLPNPEFFYVFPAGGKPFKYLVDFPVDSLVLRPLRKRAAEADVERTRERLTQAGLDLARDARLAYADWVFARDRVQIAEANRKLRDRINSLTEARLKAGDATPLEESTARIDILRARQEETRAINDLPVFEERLRNVAGLGLFRPDLIPEKSEPAPVVATNVDELSAEAIATRPDIASAHRAIEAAEARIRLAKLGWLRILGIGDSTSGSQGYRLSPGFRVGIPIFNWNQGAIARGEAERDKAIRQLDTFQQRVALEVRQAHALHVQAASDYRQWTDSIRPTVEEAVRRADNTYKEGGTSLLLVLETSRQMIDTRFREAQLRADLLKTWAELERSVGRKLLGNESCFGIER